jgi:hypothetical protein
MNPMTVKGLLRRLLSRDWWERYQNDYPLEWDYFGVWAFGVWSETSWS